MINRLNVSCKTLHFTVLRFISLFGAQRLARDQDTSFGRRRTDILDAFLLAHSDGSLDVDCFRQLIELSCAFFLDLCLVVVHNELTLHPGLGLQLRLLYALC